MKIITLTLNPAFDIHCRADCFDAYRENLAEVISREAGGKGVNISRALTLNGIENTAVTVVGDDNGAEFLRCLDEDGICLKRVNVPGRIRENITLHTEGRPETRISFKGFSCDASLLTRLREMLLPMVEVDCIVTFTGRAPDGIAVGCIAELLIELKSHGARIVIDSRSFSRDDILSVKPWLIKPNAEEIPLYINGASVLDGARALHAWGIDNVIVSLGGDGAILVCGDGAFRSVPPATDALSTIGAGDSMVAGFIAATSSGQTAKDALRLAVAYGTAACIREGTLPPLPDDIKRVYAEVSVNTI